MVNLVYLKETRGIIMKFGISWQVIQDLYVTIEASSEEEALEKFYDGEYDLSAVDVNDEDFLPERLGGHVECEGGVD